MLSDDGELPDPGLRAWALIELHSMKAEFGTWPRTIAWMTAGAVFLILLGWLAVVFLFPFAVDIASSA